jgi:hypothetical protein
MAIQRNMIFGLTQKAPASKTAGSLHLARVKNDVFLKALLETPTTQQARRSPLKWLGAVAFHIMIVAVLIIVPLYTTGTIRLSEYQEIPVVAPPPPLAPPPAANCYFPIHRACNNDSCFILLNLSPLSFELDVADS